MPEAEKLLFRLRAIEHPVQILQLVFVTDFATALACSMNSWATGLSVRFFRAKIAIGKGGTRKSIDSGLSDQRLALY